MEVNTKLIEVIEVSFHRGKGTNENPHRIVTAYYSKSGEFLAENDPYKLSKETTHD